MKRKLPEDLLPTLRLVLEGFEMVGLPALKSRDRREPGRKEKMEYEDRLRSIIVRHFGRQRRIIRERLEREYPERKALDDFDDIYEDEDLITELMRLFRDATKHGIALFGQMSKLQIDWSLTNTRAFEWAQEYTYELVKLIDNTTRDILRSSISQFVDTPGMTIRDVMDTLPFDEERAQRVAVTEITRAYATANQLAGEDLKKEFPGVPVIKIWTTNNDDKVCSICGPLDGKEVDIDDDFTTNISQPPAHVNCRCWMNTTTALADLGEEEIDPLTQSLIDNGRYEERLENGDYRYFSIDENTCPIDKFNPQAEREKIESITNYYREAIVNDREFINKIDKDGALIQDRKISENIRFTNDPKDAGFGSGGNGSAKVFWDPYTLENRIAQYPYQVDDPAYVLFHELHHGFGSGTELDTLSDFLSFDWHIKVNSAIPELGERSLLSHVIMAFGKPSAHEWVLDERTAVNWLYKKNKEYFTDFMKRNFSNSEDAVRRISRWK